jgi:hypothetical protein
VASNSWTPFSGGCVAPQFSHATQLVLPHGKRATRPPTTCLSMSPSPPGTSNRKDLRDIHLSGLADVSKRWAEDLAANDVSSQPGTHEQNRVAH